MASYSWQIASQDEFTAIYSLLYNSDLSKKWGMDDVKRRVITPLFLNQLITFYDDDQKLCGFLTCAYMSQVSADHQKTEGVQNDDWRSGDQFWVVDLVANDGGGAEILRTVMRDLDRSQVQKVHYFRLKTKELRSVRP